MSGRIDNCKLIFNSRQLLSTAARFKRPDGPWLARLSLVLIMALGRFDDGPALKRAKLGGLVPGTLLGYIVEKKGGQADFVGRISIPLNFFYMA